ncbi:lipocalin family protein [Piscinibacter sp. XHJ-5]|uniref:lipocalin family protein n=1 Tax=Piscinibacter sp. XHJ-5 TaxID=3037797 RepID=UPI0024532427|nr:lipocalin family protein [Piscinibacter sp. XHJ-5]
MSPRLVAFSRDLLAGLSLVAVVVAWSAATTTRPVRPVQQFDVQRYAGTWYEVARVPHGLHKRCVADATATYRPLADGSLRIVQRCRDADEQWGVTVGRASMPSGDAAGARMKVNYLPSWLAWWPSAHEHHWVVLLDDEYRYAVVSDPDRTKLTILSRTPSLDVATYEDIVARLRAQQYPVDRLVATPQHDELRLRPVARQPRLIV